MPFVVIDDRHGDYYCGSCDRGFNSAAAVYQHCEDTTAHTWCASCRLTFENGGGLGRHLFSVHNTCDVCGVVCRNANALQSHMDIHNQPQWECVSCYRVFDSASAMINHLENSCQAGNWSKGMTQRALSLFATFYPINYGIRTQRTGPITCGCHGKKFFIASALCQHLESESCQISYTGEEVLGAFVRMLQQTRWRKRRQGNGITVDFDHLLDEWDEGRY